MSGSSGKTGGGTVCSVDACQNEVRSRGLCKAHYAMQRNYGRTDYVKVRHKGEICSVADCGRSVKTRGLCANHYAYKRKYGRLEKLGNKRTQHPLYTMWIDHNNFGRLVPEWKDFWIFAAAVGERPSGNFVAYRADKTLPYGPTNFEWRENLRRRSGETDQAWYKRKWAARHPKGSTLERERSLRRNHGITIAEYEARLEEQEGVCAICRRPETAKDGVTSTVKRLAVDHCHASGRQRGLLCWRCNVVLGKVEDRPDLLREMAIYLEKHSGP